jgi:hypothetical protein
MLNVNIKKDGSIEKRQGWKTMRGLIKVLKYNNAACKRLGITMDYTVRLPLPK